VTGRERILAAFSGGSADYVPFAPNIYLWFYYHRYHGTLPEELRLAEHPFEVLRYLGADILARWDTQWAITETHSAGEYSAEFVTRGEPLASALPPGVATTTAFNIYPPGADEFRRRFVTPYGDLTQVWSFTPESAADFEAKYWWTDWDEYAAVRFMVEARDYVFDPDLFRHWVRQVGDDGIVLCHITQSPLKMLHWLAGPQNATLFIMDHPEETKALAKIHEEKALALLEQAVDMPEAEFFFSGDNLDSMFYPPRFYRDYCDSFFTRAAEIIHRRGKRFIVHACGRNSKLLPLVGASGVDCLEGITPAPLGDVQLGDARRMSGKPDFTVNGGMDSPHLELRQDSEAALHAYTRELFVTMGDKRHFIFASSCMTSPLTPWENLIYLRDAAREYGRIPP
jgi:hypothetical protein